MQRSEKRETRIIPQWVRKAVDWEPLVRLLPLWPLAGFVLYGLMVAALAVDGYSIDKFLEMAVLPILLVALFFVGVGSWIVLAVRWLHAEWKRIAGEAFQVSRVEAVLTSLALAVHNCPPGMHETMVKGRKSDFWHAKDVATLLGCSVRSGIRDYVDAAAKKVTHV